MATIDKEDNMLIFDNISDFISILSKLEHQGSLYQYLVSIRDDIDDFNELTVSLTHREVKMLEGLLNA